LHEYFQHKTPMAPRPFVTNFFLNYQRLPSEAGDYSYREEVAVVTFSCVRPRWHHKSEREFYLLRPIADGHVVLSPTVSCHKSSFLFSSSFHATAGVKMGNSTKGYQKT